MNFIEWLLSMYTLSAVDGDGGAPVDRGDDVAPADAPANDAPAAAAADAADGDAANDAADDQPRNEKGQFAKKDDEKFIPKSRFDDQMSKERAAREAAERRAAELEAQIKQVDRAEDLQKIEKEIAELEDKLESARLDGDKEKALQFSKELRLKERQIAIAESSRMSEAAKAQAREEIKLDLTIEKMEAQHDVLNENSESYDQDIVDMVLATQRDLIQRERMAPSRALETAVRKVMTKVMPANSDGVEPEKGGLKDAKKAADDRKQAQVAKNLDTAKRQPASMKEAGLDSDRIGQTKEDGNITEMSYEDFLALPEATKSRLRGDLV